MPRKLPRKPMLFVVHRRAGRESPALYHHGLPPVHDAIVWRHSIVEPKPLAELFGMFLQLRALGALPADNSGER